MADMNQCNFTGRLGRDPEQRTFQNGDVVANFSIAVGKKWRDKSSGEMKEQTTWVRCSTYGKTAELVMQYAKKGSQLRITGELSVRKYTDQGGAEKEVTEIKVQDFQLLGGRPDGEQGGQHQRAAAPAPARAPAPSQGGGYGAPSDDVPFAPCRMWF